MQRDVAPLIEGGIGGGMATAAMSALMMAGRKTGLLDSHLPERDRPGRTQTMVPAHWVYGGTLGLLLDAAERRRPARLDTP